MVKDRIRSVVLSKMTPLSIDVLNREILRDGLSLHEIYRRYALPCGLSYSSFYRYASKLLARQVPRDNAIQNPNLVATLRADVAECRALLQRIAAKVLPDHPPAASEPATGLGRDSEAVQETVGSEQRGSD